MKTKFITILTLCFFIMSATFAQTKIYPSNDGPGSDLNKNGITRYEGTYIQSALNSSSVATATGAVTTDDNENNTLSGIPDGDMDIYLYNTDYEAPIEFNIFVDDASVSNAQLSILAWDIDWANGERDAVYFNGNFAGYLTGANGENSTTILNIDPDWVVTGPGGKNLVKIEIDVLNIGNWAVSVDWGQLVIDGGTQTTTEYRLVTIPETAYLPCEIVSVSQEIDADPDLYVRAETNMLDPDGNIIAGTSRYLTATMGDEPFTENLSIPCSAVSGYYKIVTILYDGATSVQLDIKYTDFTVGDVTKPIITDFTIPANSTSLVVPVNSFTATDNIAVTGFKLTETSAVPLASDADWTTVAPTSYTFATEGTKTLYAWAKDEAGNVSTSESRQVIISLNSATANLGNTETFSLASSSTVRRAIPVTFNEAGQIQSISVYHNAGSGNVMLGVYSDVAGSPSGLLGVTPSTAVTTTAGWQTVSLTTPVTVTSGQKVWLAWVFENVSNVRYERTSAPASVSTGYSTWSSGIPSTFGRSWKGNFKFSVYCTYVPDDIITAEIGNKEVFSLASSSTVRRAMPVTFNEAGQIQSISVYHNAGSGNVMLGVYSDVAGFPSELLGVTPSTAVRTLEGWQTVSLTTPVSVTSGQKVWLAWVFENVSKIRYERTIAPASVSTGYSTWSSGIPTTFGKSWNGNFKFSVYCTYIADNTKSAVITGDIEPVFEKAGLKVYPNPFSDRLRFEFVSPESVNARIDLYDMTGRMVKTIFEQPIEGGVNYEADFRPETIISGMYIYRMTMGESVYNGKVVFKKE